MGVSEHIICLVECANTPEFGDLHMVVVTAFVGTVEEQPWIYQQKSQTSFQNDNTMTNF